MDIGLNGKVVVVTGAGGGVGRAIALAFAKAGAHVAVNDVLAAGLEETRTMIEAAGARAHAQVADISDAAQMAAWVEAVSSSLGTIDVLVNNAAVMTAVGPFADIDPAAWERDIRIGLLGTLTCTRAVLQHMLKRGKGGSIINIASDAGRAGNGNLVGYSSTKGGVMGFTKALAQEVGPAGIRVNAVSPGSVHAPMRDQVLRDIEDRLGQEGVEEREAKRMAQVPLRRIAEPDDIAQPVLFFASALSRHVTGQVLSVNGGFRMY
ncbi:3-oxoacyl-ACP reductase FabG [soil metagenome]